MDKLEAENSAEIRREVARARAPFEQLIESGLS